MTTFFVDSKCIDCGLFQSQSTDDYSDWRLFHPRRFTQHHWGYLSVIVQEYWFLFCSSLHENGAKCKSIGHVFGMNDFRAAFCSGAQSLRCWWRLEKGGSKEQASIFLSALIFHLTNSQTLWLKMTILTMTIDDWHYIDKYTKGGAHAFAPFWPQRSYPWQCLPCCRGIFWSSILWWGNIMTLLHLILIDFTFALLI